MTSSVTAPAFEDLSVGDEAPPLVVENISRTHFVRYAGASGDFNPMLHDDTVATSIGNPSVFGHGMLTAGLMARVLKDWFGPAALRRYQVRFSKQVWPGETLTCTATVTGATIGPVTRPGFQTRMSLEPCPIALEPRSRTSPAFRKALSRVRRRI